MKLEDQTKPIEEIFPKDHVSDEIKSKLHKIKIYENKVIRDNSFYESSKQIYDFKIFKQKDMLLIVFITTKLKYTNLIKNKLVY